MQTRSLVAIVGDFVSAIGRLFSPTYSPTRAFIFLPLSFRLLLPFELETEHFRQITTLHLYPRVLCESRELHSNVSDDTCERKRLSFSREF